MKRIFQTPRTALPLALGLVLLATVGLTASRFPANALRTEGGLGLLGVLVAAGIVLSAFKPRRGIALGSAVLAPGIVFFGPLVSAAIAALVSTAQLLIARSRWGRSAWGSSLWGRPEGPPPAASLPVASPSGDPPTRVPESVTRVLILSICALAAGSFWSVRVGTAPFVDRVGAVLFWSALAGGLQSALVLAFHWLVAWVEGRHASLPRRPDPGFLLEAIGWTLGGVLAATFAVAGVTVGLAVLVTVALLVAELVRQRTKRARDRRQTKTLRQMSMVGRRVGGGEALGMELGLEPIVAQILKECRELIEPHFLHLEIVDSDVGKRSWAMDPEGVVHEGEPHPPEAPPALPGVHRRVSWKVLDRRLEAGDKAVASLRLWTDPRRTDAERLRLLDSLLPQLASLLAAVLAERKAGRDALTGVATRAVLEEKLERIYDRCYGEGSSMSVVMCDVDRFKEINDGFGHSVGDQVLQEIAAALARHSRGRDVVCRYGGEEFTVLMDGANARAAVAVAERLRKAIEDIRFDSDGTAILLTASFGVASFPDTYVASGAELVPLADAALYEAKRRGRNRTLLALGQGQFQNARGRSLKGDTRAEAIEAPRLFV